MNEADQRTRKSRGSDRHRDVATRRLCFAKRSIGPGTLMHDLTIAAIPFRLQTKSTGLGGAAYSQLVPSDPVAIADDERQCGFTLPPLMKRMYTEIGNDGFDQ
jgi:hypothetical protein